MKKVNKSKLIPRLNAAEARARRAVDRRRAPTMQKPVLAPLILKPKISEDLFRPLPTPSKIQAPTKLDIYKTENYETFVGFIHRLRLAAQHNDRLLICFRDTYRITAGAGLRLVAEVDHLLKINPSLKINCSIPKRQSNHKYKNSDKVLESSLQQIGFFKAIGQYERAVTRYSNVTMWKQLSGDTADGSLAASLLDQLPEQITQKAKSHFYRGAIEAIANCVDHAYPDSESDRRWWMLAGTKEDRLTIIVCDLGVGIPATLPLKHPEKLLTLISRTFNILGQTDADLIRTSTFIKRTRTLMTHRGKGGADIRSIVEHYPEALLSIRSNRGAYVVAGSEFKRRIVDKKITYIEGTNDREWISNHSLSIYGTLIEWTISLEAVEK